MENDVQSISAEDVAASLLFPEDSQPDEQEQESGDQQEAASEDTQEQSVDEDESEQDEGEDAQSESEEDAEQPGQATAPADDTVVKWETGTGETFEAPLSELKAGYMRTADYTQKTQALADDRKQAEQELQGKIQEAERYTSDLGRLATIGEQIRTYEA